MSFFFCNVLSVQNRSCLHDLMKTLVSMSTLLFVNNLPSRTLFLNYDVTHIEPYISNSCFLELLFSTTTSVISRLNMIVGFAYPLTKQLNDSSNIMTFSFPLLNKSSEWRNIRLKTVVGFEREMMVDWCICATNWSITWIVYDRKPRTCYSVDFQCE